MGHWSIWWKKIRKLPTRRARRRRWHGTLDFVAARGSGCTMGEGGHISDPSKLVLGHDVHLPPGIHLDTSNGLVLPDSSPTVPALTPAGLPDPPVFVVGTGRCGTHFLARYLDRYPGVVARHEPCAALIPVLTDFAHSGDKSPSGEPGRTLDLLHRQCSNLPPGTLTYVESDQKYSFCIDLLCRHYPGARFLWLVRRPEDFLASAYPRGWYDDYELGFARQRGDYYAPIDNALHGRHRIDAAKIGEMSADAWRKLSPFARLCWYWGYTNRRIGEQLAALPAERWLRIGTEELDREKALRKLVEWVLPGSRFLPADGGTEKNKALGKRHFREDWTPEQWLAYGEIRSPDTSDLLRVTAGALRGDEPAGGLISVIVPARNAAKTLPRTIASVLGQTDNNWELILVDNGSDDATGEIFASCVLAHPHKVISLDEPVPGASRARNRGLSRARGEWIQFLDADDELAPDKLARQRALAHPETDWIIGGYRVDDPTGYVHVNLPHEDPWKGLVHGYRIGYTCSNLYRKTALERIGGWNESLPDNTDPDLHFRLLVAGAPYRFDQAVSTFYHHQGASGLSVRHAVGGNQRRVTLYAKVISHLIRERPEYWAVNDQYFFGALIRALRVLATHDLSEADEAYRAYFDPDDGWHHATPPLLNPAYTVLYSPLGFRRTEALRKFLGRLKR